MTDRSSRREEIARIIDPGSWSQWERWFELYPGGNWTVPGRVVRMVKERVEQSLAQADAILTLDKDIQHD